MPSSADRAPTTRVPTITVHGGAGANPAEAGDFRQGMRDAALAGWRVLATGDLLVHIGASLVRVLGGFAIAALVAIPLGTGIALWEWIDDVADPVVEFLRPIPPIAWIPLGILWFGIGDAQNMFIIFLGAFFPILLNTVAGVRRVDRTLVWGALTLGGRRAQIIREIVLPGALPLILTGLRIGLGVGWMALVAAELVAARSGLGRPRDDLGERRIAGHRVRQLARLGRIGAPQLDRRRRAAAFAISEIGIHGGRRGERQPGGRIEAAKLMIPIERARAAAGLDLVPVADHCLVVAPRQGDVPGISD